MGSSKPSPSTRICLTNHFLTMYTACSNSTFCTEWPFIWQDRSNSSVHWCLPVYLPLNVCGQSRNSYRMQKQSMQILAIMLKLVKPTENSEIGNCDEEFLYSDHIAMDDRMYQTIVSTPAAKSMHPLHQVGLKAISPPLAVYTKSLCRGVQIRRTSAVGGETVR